MKTLPLLVLLCACTSLPDTPIGNYPVGPVIHQPEKGQPYRCRLGDTEVIIRGGEKPDPQACKPVERI